MFYFDPTYFLFMAPAFILMLAAQWYVKSTYNKWSKVRNINNLTGTEAAERLIRTSGLHDVSLEETPRNLGDHYDTRSKTLRLSPGVGRGNSVASLAIAAHELGHAQQDKDGYFALTLRTALVPAVNIGSYLGWILIFVGLIFSMIEVAWVGVAVFSLGAVFALATIPVELNASARAKAMLTESGIIMGEEEQRGVNAVLNAAALTYVAALVSAVMTLLYYVMLVSGRGRRR